MQEKSGEEKVTGDSSKHHATAVSSVVLNITTQQPAQKRRIGKKRSVIATILLSIITLGIYYLVWLYNIFTEADLYCEGRVDITSGAAAVGFLFIPLFNVIWAIMLWYKTPGLLTKMQEADGVAENRIKHYGYYGWLYPIPVVGVILWIFMVQSAFNQYWDRVRPSAPSQSLKPDSLPPSPEQPLSPPPATASTTAGR